LASFRGGGGGGGKAERWYGVDVGGGKVDCLTNAAVAGWKCQEYDSIIAVTTRVSQ